jgi:mevalonate pyrophosphate decarboxylase
MAGASGNIMSESDFAAFRAKVLADKILQDRLRKVTDREEFVSLVVRLGAESGSRFTAADVTHAMQLGHIAWLKSWLPIL